LVGAYGDRRRGHGEGGVVVLVKLDMEFEPVMAGLKLNSLPDRTIRRELWEMRLGRALCLYR
jgi:hypothetical protein